MKLLSLSRFAQDSKESFTSVVKQHPILSDASEAIDVQCNEKQGRYLVAKEQLKSGHVIISERPYAAVLLAHHYTTHCNHCFAKLKDYFFYP